jgi:hypothetical protein
MRCISCRADMRVERVEQDQGMKEFGYQHETLRCIACGRTERRLSFSGDATMWLGYLMAQLSLRPIPEPAPHDSGIEG